MKTGWLVVAALLLVGCKSEREKHLEQVEAAWQRLATSEPSSDTERVSAYAAFLERFPEADPHGNPHAAEARRRKDEAQARLDAEAKRLQLVEKRRTQLLPLISDTLFTLATRARDYERDAHLIRMENRGVHQVGRGVLRIANWMVTHDLPPVARLREVMGAALYDKKRRAYDPKLLGELLEAAYLPPRTPLLGNTTEQLFPVFRRRLRVEMRLYRCMAELVAPRIAEIESEFTTARRSKTTIRKWLKEPPEDDPKWEPDHVWSEEWSYDHGDRRSFYGWVYYDRKITHHCGIAPGEVNHLDVGFWIRRFEDGTAPVIGDAMRRVLEAYDGEWLKSLELMPISDKIVYIEDKPMKYFGVRRVTNPARFFVVYSEWPADPGYGGEGEEGGEDEAVEAPEPEEQTIPEDAWVWFEEPTPPPEFRDEQTGDRLIRIPGELRGYLFVDEGKQLLVVHEKRTEWRDLESLDVKRREDSRGDIASDVMLTADGRRFLVRLRRGYEPAGVLLGNASTGEPSDWLTTNSLRDVAVNADASLFAGAKDGKWEVTHAAGPERKVVPMPFKAFRVALHPSLPLLVSSQQSVKKLELWDVSTGEQVGTAEGEHISEGAFAPEGRRLYTWTDEYAEGRYSSEGMLSRLDPATKTLTVEKRFKGASDGHWLPGRRMLLRENNIFRVLDGKTFQTVGRPVHARRFAAASPDGRWLLLELENDLLLWSLPAPPPEEAPVEVEADAAVDAGAPVEVDALTDAVDAGAEVAGRRRACRGCVWTRGQRATRTRGPW
ncbi:hypothetical protein ACLESO_51975, partial [Pyxidicoccus sp. 3LG]